jgi:hypothetical protein
MQSRPTGLLIGNLTVQDGCVWIVTTHARYLGLWPSNFRWAAEYAPEQRAFVEELIDQRVPANCRDGDWFVTTILPEPP